MTHDPYAHVPWVNREGHLVTAAGPYIDPHAGAPDYTIPPWELEDPQDAADFQNTIHTDHTVRLT